MSSVDASYSTTRDMEKVLTHARHGDFHNFVGDVVESLDTVDRGTLECAQGRLWLPAWLCRVYFAFHREVRLMFTVATAWTRDGGITQRWPLSMVFTQNAPWCRHFESLKYITLQLDADILECNSFDTDIFLSGAQDTISFVEVVGHFSTSKAARKLAWRDDNAVCFWAVKLDVRDLGGHLDVTQRAVAGTLSDKVKKKWGSSEFLGWCALQISTCVKVVPSLYLGSALSGLRWHVQFGLTSCP